VIFNTKDCGDLYDETIALTTIGDGKLGRKDSTDVSTKEYSDFIVVPQSCRSDSSHSPPMTPAAAATAPQELVTAIDDQPATLTRSASMMFISNDPGKPQQAVDNKHKWEIRDVIGKEVVNGEAHYLVEWSATLVPKCELGKAKALVEKFKARLRVQCRQSGEGKRGRRLHQRQASRQFWELAQQERRNRKKGKVDLGSRHKAGDR
jgi:hypothetical protein